MRALSFNEIEHVSGGEDSVAGSMTGTAMAGIGFLGLAVTIPTIVIGAVLGVPTLGVGFAVMAAGIVGTVYFGAMTVTGIVREAKGIPAVA